MVSYLIGPNIIRRVVLIKKKEGRRGRARERHVMMEITFLWGKMYLTLLNQHSQQHAQLSTDFSGASHYGIMFMALTTPPGRLREQ